MSADLDRLQGKWHITRLEMDGQEVPAGLLSAAHITIAGDRFTSAGMGAEYTGRLVLDPAPVPHHLDMKFESGPERGNTNLCIFELAGGTLTLCIATRGSVRPARFDSPPGSGIALEILARDLAGSRKTKGSKRARPSNSSGGAVTELEGEWRMVSGVMGGKAMDDETVRWVKRVTRGSKTTVHAGPQLMLEFEFTHDESKSPKTIDYTNTAGANKGKKQLGIYALANRQLTILMAAPGAPRPARLDATPGIGDTLTVWRQVE